MGSGSGDGNSNGKDQDNEAVTAPARATTTTTTASTTLANVTAARTGTTGVGGARRRGGREEAQSGNCFDQVLRGGKAGRGGADRGGDEGGRREEEVNI